MHEHTEIGIDIKPQIDYPCIWRYRVIGLSKDNVLLAIMQVFGGNADISKVEHVSSHGKYVALNCSIEVQNDAERLSYFDGLTQQPGIIMVI